MNTPLSTNGKTLVACFSHSGNTREIARQISEVTGADIFEIVPVNLYPTDYDAVVEQAKRELRKNFRPVLKAQATGLDAYDTIFVGSPNWWNTIAPPVMTWLAEHNLTGKTVVPYLTHEGSGLGRSVADVKKLCPGATVIEGHAFWGTSVKDARREICQWLDSLHLMKATHDLTEKVHT